MMKGDNMEKFPTYQELVKLVINLNRDRQDAEDALRHIRKRIERSRSAKVVKDDIAAMTAYLDEIDTKKRAERADVIKSLIASDFGKGVMR